MKTLLFALLTLVLARTGYCQSKPVTYVGVTPTGQTIQLNTDASGNLITTSGTGSIASSVTVTGTSTLIFSGTWNGTQTTSGTIPSGTIYQQFIFNSGTTTINGIAYTAGTQFYPAVVSRLYPATIYTLTGTTSSVSITAPQ